MKITRHQLRAILPKSARLVKQHQEDIALVLAIFLISFLSFQAGRLWVLNHPANPLELRSTNMSNIVLPPPSSVPTSLPTGPVKERTINLSVVGSKNSDRYHFLWCPGAARISPQNKITFINETKAQAAGYILASNCQR